MCTGSFVYIFDSKKKKKKKSSFVTLYTSLSLNSHVKHFPFKQNLCTSNENFQVHGQNQDLTLGKVCTHVVYTHYGQEQRTHIYYHIYL